MNIVIIDDEFIICNGIKNIIENSINDWDVYEVYTDAEEALEFCDWDKVDLILTDINMPNVDGLTLVDILRERDHDVHVIFISGYTEFEYAQKALKQEAIDYIIKPVSVNDLKFAIEKTKSIIDKKRKIKKSDDFIIKNIDSITKNFIYNMLFETKRLSGDEISESLEYCGLQNCRFWLARFTCSSKEFKNVADIDLGLEGFKVFIYPSISNYNVMVLCDENINSYTSDMIIKKVNMNNMSINVKEVRYTDNILELSSKNYELMSIHKDKDRHSILKNNEKSDKESVDEKAYSTLVVDVINYIKENYNKKISLAVLAEELYIHPTYLSNLFKKQTGINVIDYINNIRIEQAKNLLEDSRNKIYWVAERVGFANQRYFSQRFKKITGLTPVEYKQKLFFGE